MAVIKNDGVRVFNFAGKAAPYKVSTVTFQVDVKKQGYAHFMLKEIHDRLMF